MTVDAPPARPSPSTARPRPAPAPPLLSLQVLRAVAAMMVVLHHAGHEADLHAARLGMRPLGLDRVIDLGFGVHLFFVISGFIMLLTARGFGSGAGALVFVARRVVRVVPLYWLLTSATLLVGIVAPRALNGTPGGAGWVVGSYIFVPVPRSDGAVNPVLGQGWTLNYEMFFYALFALAMLLPRRRALAALAAALVGLVGLGRLVAPPFAASTVWTDELLLEFLFGLALAGAVERGLRLGAGAAASTVSIGIIGLIAMGPSTGAFEGLSPVIREGVPATLIVGGCVLGPRWAAGRAVAALAALGDASYSLYLSHPFAVRALGLAWSASAIPLGFGAEGTVSAALYLAAACTAAVFAALTLHRLVERPMTQALVRRCFAGRASRPVLPSVLPSVLRPVLRPVLPQSAADAPERRAGE